MFSELCSSGPASCPAAHMAFFRRSAGKEDLWAAAEEDGSGRV